jgi:hypothetical protein
MRFVALIVVDMSHGRKNDGVVFARFEQRSRSEEQRRSFWISPRSLRSPRFKKN